MRSTRALVIGLTAAVVVAVVVRKLMAVTSRSAATATKEDTTPSPSPATADGDLQRQLADLRTEVRLLRAAAASPARDGSASNSASASEPASPMILQQRDQARKERILGTLAMRIAQETKDSVWSEKTEDAIRGVFSSDLPSGSVLRNVVCKTSLCKVTVENSDKSAQHGIPMAIAPKEPFRSSDGNYYQYEEAGALATTVFMMRPGAPSPNIDSAE
jgi:hypothetical protein